jgi:aryl-alcohol dehydrogenase-like predicted oxidoreductase
MKREAGEDFLSERSFDILEKLKTFAKGQGHTVGELAIAWLLSHPWVSSVIAGSVQPEQIEANLKGTEWTLTTEELTLINQMTSLKE